MFVSSHILSEAEALADRVSIIRDGVVGSIAASQASGSLTTLVKAVSAARGRGRAAHQGHKPLRLLVLAGTCAHKS